MPIIRRISLFLLFFCCRSEVVHCQTCTVTTSSNPLAFGAFNPFQAVPITGINQTLSIRCTGPNNPVTYTLEATAGGNGTYNPRHMQRNGVGPETLAYNLYIDAARTTYWGIAPNAFVNAPGVHCRPVAQCVHIAYGQIPAPQPTVRGGSYSANITATLTYNP